MKSRSFFEQRPCGEDADSPAARLVVRAEDGLEVRERRPVGEVHVERDAVLGWRGYGRPCEDESNEVLEGYGQHREAVVRVVQFGSDVFVLDYDCSVEERRGSRHGSLRPGPTAGLGVR